MHVAILKYCVWVVWSRRKLHLDQLSHLSRRDRDAMWPVGDGQPEARGNTACNERVRSIARRLAAFIIQYWTIIISDSRSKAKKTKKVEANHVSNLTAFFLFNKTYMLSAHDLLHIYTACIAFQCLTPRLPMRSDCLTTAMSSRIGLSRYIHIPHT